MLDTYINFCRARHQVWLARQEGRPQPWTDDPIVASHKFCNIERIHDAGSQFLVRELLTSDVLMRCVLYRYTNRPEPWQHFYRVVGRYPTAADLNGDLQSVWGDYKAQGHPIFSSAYKMFAGKENKGTDRLTWALNLARNYFSDSALEDKFLAAQSLQERLEVLQTIPRCAGFMSMQVATDYGYYDSTFTEDEFIIAGPGAKLGAKYIYPGENPVEVIHRLRDHWAEDGSLNLSSINRSPSLMIVQNTLCEFGKYVRWSSQPMRTKPYTPTNPGKQPEPVYPDHWRN